MSTLIKTLLLVLEELFYFVFPLSEDEQTIKKLTRDRIQHKLRVRRRDDCIALTLFEDAEIRALLHLVKFHRHPRALMLVASLLETWLSTHAPEPSIIIPIPLSKGRERKRGYNQVELIVRAATRNLPAHRIDTNTLRRIKDTKPQTSLKRAERLKNMTGAFAVLPESQELHGAHIILIDDVLTTGATMRAAKTALQPCTPQSITCVAIAH